MKRVALCAMALLVLFGCGPGRDRSAPDAAKGTVTSVLDGDTLIVTQGGETVNVDLYAVDCPELKQPFGPEAKAFTSKMVLDKEVSLVIVDTGNQDLTVGHVMLPDGSKLGVELMQAGLGWWNMRMAASLTSYKDLEETARRERVGLWADREAVPPWDFRKQQPEE